MFILDIMYLFINSRKITIDCRESNTLNNAQNKHSNRPQL